MEKVQNVVLVLSGKGGVGKSTVSTYIATHLAQCMPASDEPKVGLLDIDLTGPSIPRMLNITESKVHQSSTGWVPVRIQQRLAVMSIGFLLQNKDDAIVWRGPKKNAMIKQFLNDVAWGPLDYLIIDTPPGTSDEHISVVEYLNNYAHPINAQEPVLKGAVIVTSPQAVSLADVRKELNFCQKVGVKILGIIENMSGYVCPHCQECTQIFSKGGGEALAKEYNVPFLGCIPIDPTLTQLSESSTESTLLDVWTHSSVSPQFHTICQHITQQVDAKEE